MRVRLTYSVELDEVPDSVADLLEDELHRVEEVKETIDTILAALTEKEPHLELAAKSIEKARNSLSAIDTRLSECGNILAGYERALNPEEPPAPQPPPAPSEDQQFDGEY